MSKNKNLDEIFQNDFFENSKSMDSGRDCMDAAGAARRGRKTFCTQKKSSRNSAKWGPLVLDIFCPIGMKVSFLMHFCKVFPYKNGILILGHWTKIKLSTYLAHSYMNMYCIIIPCMVINIIVAVSKWCDKTNR
jgi:hypothetical protein